MAELQQDRSGGGMTGPTPGPERVEHFDHVAVGYTNRRSLDEFIEGEAGDLVVRGPIHTGESVGEIGTLGTGVTQGTPCLVVPLIHERMDEIGREVDAALAAFQSRWNPPGGGAEPSGTTPRSQFDNRGQLDTRRTTPTDQVEPRPRNYGETGGTALGTSSGSIRKGSAGSNID